MASENPALDAEILSDDGVRAADKFQREFAPKGGVEYGWAEAHAKELYLHYRQVLKNIDDKATVVINYLASGAGLFTLGSLAGVAAAKVPPVAAWAALPAMLCAVVAIVFATLARYPRRLFPPGGADQVAAVAEHFGTEKAARDSGVMLAHWHLLTALLRRPLAAKAWNLEAANWLFVAAIALLLLPLVVGLIVGPLPSPGP